MLYTVGRIAKKYNTSLEKIYTWRSKINKVLFDHKISKGINQNMPHDQYGRDILLGIYEQFYPKVPNLKLIFQVKRSFILILRSKKHLLIQNYDQTHYNFPTICQLDTKSKPTLAKIFPDFCLEKISNPKFLFGEIDIINNVPILLETYVIFSDTFQIKYPETHFFIDPKKLKKLPNITRLTSTVLQYLVESTVHQAA